jgi:hypothetical protein
VDKAEHMHLHFNQMVMSADAAVHSEYGVYMSDAKSERDQRRILFITFRTWRNCMQLMARSSNAIYSLSINQTIALINIVLESDHGKVIVCEWGGDI